MTTSKIKRQPGRLYKTTNYDLFELHPRNRDLHSDRSLDRSMEEYGFMPSRPLQVMINGNGKLKILAGNNRFQRARSLGLPVYYVVDESCTDLFQLEGTGRPKWSVKDFAVAYAKSGHKEYVHLIEFQEKHHLTLGMAGTLVAGFVGTRRGRAGEMIKNGTFKRGDMKHAKAVVRITGAARDAGIEFATNANFASAVSSCVLVPEFDADLLISRMSRYPKHMNKRSSRDDYISEIEDLYNYTTRSGRKLPLAHLAKQSTNTSE